MIADSPKLTFYHSPHTRSVGTFALLEELGVPYDLKIVQVRKGETRSPEYLAINPMGKVPAITHGDALITEQVAIAIYLADLFSEKNLAPAPTDVLRGPYLRWMLFYAGAFEPALMDKAMGLAPTKQSQSGYGDFDTVMRTVTAHLAKGPYILGDTFSAADIVWGLGLGWVRKMVPDNAAVSDFAKRITSRQSFATVKEKDAELAPPSP
jgi:glutathione S-transferase